jgi:hypothetical protein
MTSLEAFVDDAAFYFKGGLVAASMVNSLAESDARMRRSQPKKTSIRDVF